MTASQEDDEMDLVGELDQRLAGIETLSSLERIKAAIRHIHNAERHLEAGRKTGNHDLFNDVVYRTNQAFEGMLKEAYRVLANTDAMRLSPHQIERHLIQGNHLTRRVLALFQNYRQNWRNPATHDHTLLFKEQEALLAIVSVSAFAIVLLDQIVEVTTAQRVTHRVADMQKNLGPLLGDLSNRPLADVVALLLTAFSATMFEQETTNPTEATLIGSLSGFIMAADPAIEITREPDLAEGVRPDLAVKKRDSVVLVGLAGHGATGGVREGSISKMYHYLLETKLHDGVVFAPPRERGEHIKPVRIPFTNAEIIVVTRAIDEALGLFHTIPFDKA